MKYFVKVIMLFGLLTMPLIVFAANIETFLLCQIAVEKLTGRGGDSEFSGWVGSLQFDIEEKLIFISEFAVSDKNELSVVNGIYKITKLEQTKKCINFECIDKTLFTKGIEWTGKIWITDGNVLKIEMIQKQSPRRWVNISNIGKNFLKKNKLNLNLGI